MSIPTARYPLPTTQEQRSKLVDEVLGRTPKRAASAKVTADKASQVRIPANRAVSRSLAVVGAGAAQKPRMSDILKGLDDAQRPMDTNDAKDFVKLKVPSEALVSGLRRAMGAQGKAPLHELLEGKTIQEAVALVKKAQANLQPKNVRAQLMALSPAGTAVQKLLEQNEPLTLPKILAGVSDDASANPQGKFKDALKGRSLQELITLENQLQRSVTETVVSLDGVALDTKTQNNLYSLKQAITTAKDQAIARQDKEAAIRALPEDQLWQLLSNPSSSMVAPRPVPAHAPPSGGVGSETKQTSSGTPDLKAPRTHPHPLPVTASVTRTTASVNDQVKELLALVKRAPHPVIAKSHLKAFQSHELETMQRALYTLSNSMTEATEKQGAAVLRDAIADTLKGSPKSSLSVNIKMLESALDRADVAPNELDEVLDRMVSEELDQAEGEITLRMKMLDAGKADDGAVAAAKNTLGSLCGAIQAKRDANSRLLSSGASSPLRTWQSVNEQVSKFLSIIRSTPDADISPQLQALQSHELLTLSMALEVLGQEKGLPEEKRVVVNQLREAVDAAWDGKEVSSISQNIGKLESFKKSANALGLALDPMASTDLALVREELTLRIDIYRAAESMDDGMAQTLNDLIELRTAVQQKLDAVSPSPLSSVSTTRTKSQTPSSRPGSSWGDLLDPVSRSDGGAADSRSSSVNVSSQAGLPDLVSDPLVQRFKSKLHSPVPERVRKYFGPTDDGPLSTLLAPVGGFARQLGKARIHLQSRGVGMRTEDTLPNIKKAAQELIAAARDAATASPADKTKNKNFLDAAARLRQSLHLAEVGVEDTIKEISGKWFKPPLSERTALNILQKGVPDKHGRIQQKPQMLLPPKPQANRTGFDDASGLYSLTDEILASKSPPADVAKAFLKALGA